YDPRSGEWGSGGDLPTPRDHLAAVNSAGALDTIGGRLGGDSSKNLSAHELLSDNGWETRAPLPTARSGIAAVELNGLVYVFGGEAPTGTFNIVDAYNSQTDSWETMPPMPTARHGLGAAVVGDTIYVIGGGPAPGLSVSGANEAFTP
ncbi:MAG: galactose oxidase, partial [Chloroflexi bacterium]